MEIGTDLRDLLSVDSDSRGPDLHCIEQMLFNMLKIVSLLCNLRVS